MVKLQACFGRPTIECELNEKITSHHVIDLVRVGLFGDRFVTSFCSRCGAQLGVGSGGDGEPCPAAEHVHEHELVTDALDGLLYCRRCPLIAYDLDDVATEPICPMPLEGGHTP
jgi:hypothetical protein